MKNWLFVLVLKGVISGRLAYTLDPGQNTSIETNREQTVIYRTPDGKQYEAEEIYVYHTLYGDIKNQGFGLIFDDELEEFLANTVPHEQIDRVRVAKDTTEFYLAKIAFLEPDRILVDYHGDHFQLTFNADDNFQFVDDPDDFSELKNQFSDGEFHHEWWQVKIMSTNRKGAYGAFFHFCFSFNHSSVFFWSAAQYSS